MKTISIKRSISARLALMHHGDVFASSDAGINTFGLTLAMSLERALKEPESRVSAPAVIRPV